MDSLVAQYQDKLATFRIKELKDVLSHIGIAKQGKKQALLDRIMTVLTTSDQQGYKPDGWGKKQVVGREELAKVIDNIFSKLHGSGAPQLTSKMRNGRNSHTIVHADEFEQPATPEAKTCCPCGSSMDHGTMIQCDQIKCGVWQHLACVVIPEIPVEGFQPDVPPQYYCQVCRINRADPFCVTLSQPLLPTKLTTSIVTAEGSSQLQNVEKTFVLTKANRDLLQKPGYNLQVWCLLLNDKVPFRMHWPQYADLRVNGISVWVTNRQGSQLLGINGRDDGPGITACSREGTNRISISAYDARPFCLGVRIIQRRTVQEILSLVPNESEGELFEEALARVQRCVGGGTSKGNSNDDDSDLKVVEESVSVNLRCPLSGSRIKVAGRFKPCIHMGCFDLNTFVELNQRARKWQCPICLKNYSLENIIIDPYFNRITSMINSYPEDVIEVEVKPDGCWRPKHDGENKFPEHWHLPDGSVYMNSQDVTTSKLVLNKIKQEGISDCCMTLKIGMKRNRDGYWEINSAKDIQSPMPNRTSRESNTQKLKIMPHGSSETASNKDEEDASVNQEASWNLDFPANNDVDFDSASLGNSHPPSNVFKPISLQHFKESDVIILSGSEEENGDDLNIGSSTTSAFAGSNYLGPSGSKRLNRHALLEDTQVNNNGIPFVPASSSGIPVSFCDVSSLPDNMNPPLDLFGCNGGKFSLPHWLVHGQNATYQLFGTDSNVPPASTNSCGDPVVHPTPFNRDGVDPQQQENSFIGTRIPEYYHRSDSPPVYLSTQADDDLNDNSVGVGTADTPLQFLLPPQPARASVQGDTRESGITPNDLIQTNWISLSLGSGAEICSHESLDPLHEIRQSEDERGKLDSLANTASVLLNPSNNRTQMASVDNCSSENPFPLYQQPRSVCPQLYLPLDSGSD